MVLEASDSASVLEEIDRENMFLVPLDVSRHWYRYHHLFGELLRAELRRTEPGRVRGLHRRAATWFEGEGLIDEALRHLVAAGDIAKSADLIAADWADEFNGGGLSTVSGCLDLLPYETVSQDPRLSAARAWIALNVGQLDEAASWIEKVEARPAHDTTDGGGTAAQVVVLHAFYSFKTGDVRGALETARRAVTLSFGEAPLARSGAHCVHGSALLLGATATHRRPHNAPTSDDQFQTTEHYGGTRRPLVVSAFPRQLALHSEVFVMSPRHAVTNLCGQYS